MPPAARAGGFAAALAASATLYRWLSSPPPPTLLAAPASARLPPPRNLAFSYANSSATHNFGVCEITPETALPVSVARVILAALLLLAPALLLATSFGRVALGLSRSQQKFNSVVPASVRSGYARYCTIATWSSLFFSAGYRLHFLAAVACIIFEYLQTTPSSLEICLIVMTDEYTQTTPGSPMTDSCTQTKPSSPVNRTIVMTDGYAQTTPSSPMTDGYTQTTPTELETCSVVMADGSTQTVSPIVMTDDFTQTVCPVAMTDSYTQTTASSQRSLEKKLDETLTAWDNKLSEIHKVERLAALKDQALSGLESLRSAGYKDLDDCLEEFFDLVIQGQAMEEFHERNTKEYDDAHQALTDQYTEFIESLTESLHNHNQQRQIKPLRRRRLPDGAENMSAAQMASTLLSAWPDQLVERSQPQRHAAPSSSSASSTGLKSTTNSSLSMHSVATPPSSADAAHQADGPAGGANEETAVGGLTGPGLPVPYQSNGKDAEAGTRYLCKNGGACRGTPSEYNLAGDFTGRRPDRYGGHGGRNSSSNKNYGRQAKKLQLCADCYVVSPEYKSKQEKREDNDGQAQS